MYTGIPINVVEFSSIRLTPQDGKVVWVAVNLLVSISNFTIVEPKDWTNYHKHLPLLFISVGVECSFRQRNTVTV